MPDLTQRQIKILKCITEEFIETAAPVGSETLEKKFTLGISSATIRNEMSALTQLGYLKKSHLSAGRQPTSMGLKYYVRNLMTPKNLSISEEIGAKEKIWDYRNEFERLLKETTKELANRTRSLAIATTDQGAIYNYGASNLLEEPEFYNIDVTKTVLSLIDNTNYWFEIINKTAHIPDSEEQVIHLLIGEDLGLEHLEPCGFIYQRYQSGPHRGILGVVGPARFRYPQIVPIVDYFAELISTISR
jgi:heat-inducible transcriptional repressor